MRALLFVAVLVPVIAVAGAAAAPSGPQASQASSAATFVVTGHGWGHGVGLSQCGALGFGKHGWNYVQILRHYYQGTQITTTPETRVRVLIADGRSTLSVVSKSPFKVKDGSGKWLLRKLLRWELVFARLNEAVSRPVKIDDASAQMR